MTSTRGRWWGTRAAALLCAGLLVAGCSVGSTRSESPDGSSNGATTTEQAPSATASAASSSAGGATAGGPSTAGASSKPGVPASGAYLGAWVNPVPPSTKPSKQQVQSGQVASGAQEIGQLPAFTSLIGTRMQILHVYSEFASPLPTATLDSIESYGATPMLDWSCSNVGDITSGKDDALITKYAQGLRSFSKPIFLRWYWEMNLNDQAHQACGGSSDPAQYIAAWRHIWTQFQSQHVTNVAFVWCPSGLPSKTPASAYYPGDSYVDWIGIDHYDVHGGATTGAAAVTALFGGFYRDWSGHGKPLMIGETGAQPADQAGFLNGLRTTLPSTYPDFKALIYFDSPGQVGKPTKATKATQAGKAVKGPYNLQGDGVTAFKGLANDPYFGYARR